ncbi:hypothetical protein [Haliangium sp. UPWRP_2]|uniref:hypothetical protein n=1 Tax=Haliangium sp. UPWRP_2 TaxID=1931276 RepID=UPI000B53DBCB|nr:hypothetical protein [Haliangium sp. UPWRP_2]PSM32464.1 hypothetical protein BVG81_000205 [Haliangium sp. UPWRP_2]HNN92072.1 hypothetical protein [Pseudomonadota bacterium]
MRNYWLTCGALALLAIALFVAPLRLMRRARAAQPIPAVTQPVAPPVPVREPPASPVSIPTPAPAAASAPAPLLIDFGGDEAEADAEETVQGNEPPPLSEADAATAKKNLEWAMRGLLPEINGCYKQALTRDPALRGDLNIEMTLVPASDSSWAKVEDAVIADNALQSPLLEQCVLLAVTKLRMQKPAGRLYITYPLHLQPGGDASSAAKTNPSSEPEFEVGEGTISEGDDGDDD